MLKIVFLGTGAAGDTPGIGKSKRQESSILIKNNFNILIDVTRDFANQSKLILTQIGKSAPAHEIFEKEIRKICKKAFPAYDGLVYHI